MSRKRTYYDDRDYGAGEEPRPPGLDHSPQRRPRAFPDDSVSVPSQSKPDRSWDSSFDRYNDRFDRNNGHRFHGNADQRYPNNGGRQFNPSGDYPREEGYDWYNYQPRFDAAGGPTDYPLNAYNYQHYPPPPLPSDFPGGRGRPFKKRGRSSTRPGKKERDAYAGTAKPNPTDPPTTPKVPISSMLSIPNSSSPGSKLATVSAVANAMLGQTNKKQGARGNGCLKVGADGKTVVQKAPGEEKEKTLAQKMHSDGKPLCEVLYPGNRLPTGKFVGRRPTNNGMNESDSDDDEDPGSKNEAPPPSQPVVINHPIMKPLPPLRSHAHVAVPFVTMTTSSKPSTSSAASKPFLSPPVVSLPPFEPQIRVKSEPPDYAATEPTTEQLMALFEQNQDKFINEDMTPPPIETAPSVSPVKHRENTSSEAESSTSPPAAGSVDAVPDYFSAQVAAALANSAKAEPVSPNESNGRFGSRNGYRPYQDPRPQSSTENTMLDALENELQTAQEEVLNKQAVVRDLLTQQIHAQTDLDIALQRLNSLAKTVLDLKRQ